MKLKETILSLLQEQNILKTTATKPIVDAIKNRRKISFNYSGKRKPKKDSVKPGKRVKVEPVAIGLSKKGNLIIRAWVEPPSVSKTGFQKGKWRTFILGRASNIEITDETFDEKRPDYKEGDDGSMTVTYATTDWTKKPRIKKYEKPFKTPQEKPKIEPQVIQTEPQPKTQELPQPKPEEKPEPIKQELPQPKSDQSPEPPKTEPTKSEPQSQELPQPKPEEKPSDNPIQNPEEKDEEENLQETIKRIKTLMFS
jgi:hypothetical protein